MRPMEVLFECIDGPSKGLMISHKNGILSCKVRKQKLPRICNQKSDVECVTKSELREGSFLMK